MIKISKVSSPSIRLDCVHSKSAGKEILGLYDDEYPHQYRFLEDIRYELEQSTTKHNSESDKREGISEGW